MTLKFGITVQSKLLMKSEQKKVTVQVVINACGGGGFYTSYNVSLKPCKIPMPVW